MYSIGDFSKKTGISISTLRYYDKEGVLVPEHKADNGYRYYTDEQVINALFINNMKRLDLSLDIIRDLVDAEDPIDMHQKIVEQKARLQDAIDHLSFFENTYLNASISKTNFENNRYDISKDMLSGCGYISKKFDSSNQEIRSFVSGDMMDILVECNYLVLEQNMCMRIMCTSLAYSNCDSDVLVVPIKNVYNVMDSDNAGFMADQSTLSISVVNSSMDFSEPVFRLREYAAAHNIKLKAIPIVDILCDPGDIPNAKNYIAKVHIPILNE